MRVRSLLSPLTRVAFEDDGTLRPNALLNGILAMRWGVLVWLAILVVTGDHAVPTALAWAALVAATGWTAYLTRGRARWTLPVLSVDLLVSAALLVLAAVSPSLATIYPVTAALSWGARRGAVAGAVSGALLGAVFVGASLAAGVPADLAEAGLVSRIGSALNLVIAGGGIGLVSTLIRRSVRELRAAQAAEVEAREDAARLAEREQLGRQIHDTVLQVLAMVNKRATEYAAGGDVPRAEVARLAALAAEQERHLRDLIAQPVARERPTGTLHLRTHLTSVARGHEPSLTVEVAGEDPAVPAHVALEIGAAVDQALANVGHHAGTDKATVYVESPRTGSVAVSVRDDGKGFTYDEKAMVAGGHFGLAYSVKGRIEQLGGTVAVDSRPGAGTEIEMCVPTGGES